MEVYPDPNWWYLGKYELDIEQCNIYFPKIWIEITQIIIILVYIFTGWSFLSLIIASAAE